MSSRVQAPCSQPCTSPRLLRPWCRRTRHHTLSRAVPHRDQNDQSTSRTGNKEPTPWRCSHVQRNASPTALAMPRASPGTDLPAASQARPPVTAVAAAHPQHVYTPTSSNASSTAIGRRAAVHTPQLMPFFVFRLSASARISSWCMRGACVVVIRHSRIARDVLPANTTTVLAPQSSTCVIGEVSRFISWILSIMSVASRLRQQPYSVSIAVVLMLQRMVRPKTCRQRHPSQCEHAVRALVWW